MLRTPKYPLQISKEMIPLQSLNNYNLIVILSKRTAADHLVSIAVVDNTTVEKMLLIEACIVCGNHNGSSRSDKCSVNDVNSMMCCCIKL